MSTVLLAEDDPLLLNVLRRMLRHAGYHVIAARNGRDAWSLFQRATDPIDLVLTDVVMPHMSGTELAARIADQQPELPLILMTGYAPEDLARRGLVLSRGHLLTKPFEHDGLLDLLRQLLPT